MHVWPATLDASAYVWQPWMQVPMCAGCSMRHNRLHPCLQGSMKCVLPVLQVQRRQLVCDTAQIMRPYVYCFPRHNCRSGSSAEIRSLNFTPLFQSGPLATTKGCHFTKAMRVRNAATTPSCKGTTVDDDCRLLCFRRGFHGLPAMKRLPG